MATVLTTTARTVAPLSVRDRAHRAACALHTVSGNHTPCEMGGGISAAVLDDLAAWLRDPTSGAAQTVQDALRGDATTNPLGSPLTGAQAACDALAALLDGAS